MSNIDNDAFVKQLTKQLQESVDGLDAETQSKITQARHQALAGDKTSKPFNFLLPAGAAAMLFLAVMIYTLVPESTSQEPAMLEELELIAELEFYEKLEFYEWLEQHELPG